MAAKESWSKRQLERQIRAALFERTVLSPPKAAPVVREIDPEALSVFRDNYTLEFLGLPQADTEAELHRGILNSLREFLIEMGRDFCFVGSEVPPAGRESGFRPGSALFPPRVELPSCN